MKRPVNLDSVSLAGTLGDWVATLDDFGVGAVAVTGPNPSGGSDDRDLIAVHPPEFAAVAEALARSSDFGALWRDLDAPLAVWQRLAGAPAGSVDAWRGLSLAQGFQTVVRLAFPLPAGRAFDFFMFSRRPLRGREEAAGLVWSALGIWPVLRMAIAQGRCKLSPRERECLALAFCGLTARESAGRMACGERTVNYHLANAMGKLGVDNKVAAIQRACWLGVI